MEILFENKYTRNKELLKDVYTYAYFRRPLYIVLYIYFLLYLAWGIYDAITNRSFSSPLLIIPVIWFALILLMYFRNINTVLKRDLEIHGKPIEVVVTVTDEKISQKQSTGSEYYLNYVDIKRAAHNENYIFLWSKTNLIYLFKIDSFSIGSADDLICFLQKKGIKIK